MSVLLLLLEIRYILRYNIMMKYKFVTPPKLLEIDIRTKLKKLCNEAGKYSINTEFNRKKERLKIT